VAVFRGWGELCPKPDFKAQPLLARGTEGLKLTEMKNKARTLQDHIDALNDAVLVLHDAHLATLAWLMAVGRPSSAQLVRELKAEHANVKASRKELKQVCGKQPKRAGCG
jgi:hypothetical protein